MCIGDSYLNLTAASSQYQDNWICDETWFRLLNAHYLYLKNTFNFTREGLNCTLSAKAGPFTGLLCFSHPPAQFRWSRSKSKTASPITLSRHAIDWNWHQRARGGGRGNDWRHPWFPCDFRVNFLASWREEEGQEVKISTQDSART